MGIWGYVDYREYWCHIRICQLGGKMRATGEKEKRILPVIFICRMCKSEMDVHRVDGNHIKVLCSNCLHTRILRLE